MFRFVIRLTVALALLGLAGTLAPDRARAQEACPATDGADGFNNTVRALSVIQAGAVGVQGDCLVTNALESEYIDPDANSARDFGLYLPGDAPRTGAATGLLRGFDTANVPSGSSGTEEGVAMAIRSTDQGKTWEEPQRLGDAGPTSAEELWRAYFLHKPWRV